jgi:hypothetical protein
VDTKKALLSPEAVGEYCDHGNRNAGVLGAAGRIKANKNRSFN